MSIYKQELAYQVYNKIIENNADEIFICETLEKLDMVELEKMAKDLGCQLFKQIEPSYIAPKMSIIDKLIWKVIT